MCKHRMHNEWETHLFERGDRGGKGVKALKRPELVLTPWWLSRGENKPNLDISGSLQTGQRYSDQGISWSVC